MAEALDPRKVRVRVLWLVFVRAVLGGVLAVVWPVLMGIMQEWGIHGRPAWIWWPIAGLLAGIVSESVLFAGPWWRRGRKRPLLQFASGQLVMDTAVLIGFAVGGGWSWMVAFVWLIWIGLALNQHRWIRLMAMGSVDEDERAA